MAAGRFLMLPSVVILLAYIGTLVAVVDRHSIATNKVLYKSCHYENENCISENKYTKLESISSVLANTNSFPDTVDVLTKLASAIPVTFEPSVLDFRERPIGMPQSQVVKLINPSNSLTLQLISLSGTKSEFHTSFFVNNILRPGESTTFDVMFLAKTIGLVDDTIMIHSSLGLFEYKVSGSGLQNPFRLRSFFGARIPFNATYQPAISIYNPYNEPLQILEVYSTDEHLQLELPSNTNEGNKSVWDVRPYETKTIARVNFRGYKVENYTAFIRIKMDHVSKPSIVIPFEVEVCEPIGLFVSKEIFDFGIVRSDTESKLSLHMLNAGPNVVEIKSVTVIDNPAIKIAITNTTLKPSLRYVKVAVLTYSGALASDHESGSGTIKIWAKDHVTFYQTMVPYIAEIMRGSLDYEYQQTLFQVHKPPFVPIIRELRLTNLFKSPVAIYSAKFHAKYQDWFSLHSFVAPYILPADGNSHPILVLKFNIQSSECFFNTTLRLATNTSFFNIPLQCYDGRLHYDFGGRDVDALEFGTLSHLDTASKIFTITNRNPVKVSIQTITVHEIKDLPYLSYFLLELPPPDPNEKPVILKDGFRKGRRPPHDMRPGERIVFRVNITRPRRPGRFSGELLLHSSLGKVVTVPVNYIAVTGAVQFVPKKLHFSRAFFYSPTNLHLYIKSTYTKPVKLVSLVIGTSNTSSNHTLPILLPKKLSFARSSTTTMIGDVVLDPMLLCKEPVSPIVLKTIEGGNVWKSYKNDTSTLERLWEAWQDIVSMGVNFFSFNLKILTEMNEEAVVPIYGSIVWPRIATSDTLSFPLTLIGNYSTLSITLQNPSTSPVYIEPMLLTQQIGSSHHLLSLLSDVYNTDISLYNQTADNIYRISLFNDTIPTQDPFNLDPPELKFVLKPYGKQKLKIIFRPSEDRDTNMLLLIRNNLTVIDYVKISGAGTPGYISLDDIHPHRTQPLLFEFTQSFMEGYLLGMECGMPSNEMLSYSKTFHVRNSGPKPVNIKRVSVGDRGCSSNGFHVTNCDKSVIVYPNKTRKIEILCIPDFTLSRITDTLHLHLADGTLLDFPLLATLPHQMLPSCYSTLPYTAAEELANYLSGPLWILTLLIMIIVTVLQVKWHSRNLLGSSRVSGKDVPVQSTGGTVFKFTDIARVMRNTINDKMEDLRKSVSKESFHVEEFAPPTEPILEEEQRLKPIPNPIPYHERLIEPVVKTITTDHHTGIRHESNVISPLKSIPSGTVRTPTEDIDPHPQDTPHSNKKLKNSRKMTQVKRLDKTSSAEMVVLEPSLFETKLEQFQRKESDESIKSVDSDLTSPSVSNHSSYSPDSDSSRMIDLVETFEAKSKTTSYPLTGQTIEVSSNAGSPRDEPVNNELSTSSNCTSVPSSPPLSTRSANKMSLRPSKKKQKIQHKKEDKLRKKREREAMIIEQSANLKMKQSLGSQESLDKESVASNSTNSTDNLEDESTCDQSSCTEESNKKSEEFAELSSELKKEENEVESLNESFVGGVEEEPTEIENTSNSDVDLLAVKEEVANSFTVENERKDVDTCTNDSVQQCEASKTLTSSEEKCSISSEIKEPPLSEQEQPLSTVAAVDPVSEDKHTNSSKSRPKKLNLETGSNRGNKSEQVEASTSSAEVDGANEKRLAPHELASSILSNSVNRSRSGKGNKSTPSSSSSKEPSKGNEEVTIPTKTNKKKQNQDSQLSHEAQPFHPGYLPPPHYHMPPHPVPPHLLPSRCSHLVPRPPPHLHRSSPPYEYPPPHHHHSPPHPMRRPPTYDDFYIDHMYDQSTQSRHRKLSDMQKPQKVYMPHPPHPYYAPPPQESSYCDVRSRPRMYPEWGGAHSMDHAYYDDVTNQYYSPKHRAEMGARFYSGSHIPAPIWRTPPHQSQHQQKRVKQLDNEYIQAHQQQMDDSMLYRRQIESSHQLLDMDMPPVRDSYWNRERATSYQELDTERAFLLQQEKWLAKKRTVSEESNRMMSSELSSLLSPPSSGGWGPLNKAPGSQPNQISDNSELKSLFDGRGDYMQDSDNKEYVLNTDDTSTCQRLWSMNLPLSKALEEAARLSSAPSPPPFSTSFDEKSHKPSSHTEASHNYELFESGVTHNIWSFSGNSNATAGDSIFPWKSTNIRYTKP